MPMDETLITLIARQFGISNDQAVCASMENTERWNSLSHVEFIMTLEEEYQIGKFTSDEIVEMIDINRVDQILKQKLFQASSRGLGT